MKIMHFCVMNFKINTECPDEASIQKEIKFKYIIFFIMYYYII